jgi:SAM-dependent methyltransferase
VAREAAVSGVAKAAFKGVLAAIGLEVRRSPEASRPARLREFAAGGAVPWSPGYREAKEDLIEASLRDSAVMRAFADGAALPAGYGRGFDERSVEYPWLFSQLAGAQGPVLDAGSVFNHAYVLRHLPFEPRGLHILTLAPESESAWQQGISYLFADLRDIPIRDNYYPHVACISTLEHVGFDNSGMSGLDAHREHRPDDFLAVMKELHRVLQPDGTLYLTVPYGVPTAYAGFQQFGAATLQRAIDAFGPSAAESRQFFRYRADGWTVAPQAACDDAVFVEWILKVWRGELRFADATVDPDRAAASRAVACVRLRKR